VLVSQAFSWRAVVESARMWMSVRNQVFYLAVSLVSIPRVHISVPVIMAIYWSLMATPVKQQVKWSWEYLLRPES
jgi:hypothetical protein